MKFHRIAIIMGLLLAFSSCASLAMFSVVGAPDQIVSNSGVAFSVLGPVSVTKDDLLDTGSEKIDLKALAQRPEGIRALLLEAAKKQYPQADRVVDITVSGVQVGGLSLSIIFEGVAIDLQ